MSGLMDLISQHIGKDQINRLAKHIGASPEQTESAVSLAIPTLLGAVTRRADSNEGAQQLHQQLQQHDAGGLLGQLTGMLGGGMSGGSTGQVVTSALGGGVGDILGNILGSRQSKVEQGIGKASGLTAAQIGSLMALLAPLVLGTLGKHQKSQNMDAGVFADMLRKEKQSMENQASGGLLSGLLDQDGDGDFDFQDIMKLGMKKLFGR